MDQSPSSSSSSKQNSSSSKMRTFQSLTVNAPLVKNKSTQTDGNSSANNWKEPERTLVVEAIVKELSKSKGFIERFSALNDNSERIRLCLSMQTVRELLDKQCKRFSRRSASVGQKDPVEAAVFRAKGYEAFLKKDHANAIVHYTVALSFAPEVGDQHGEAPLLYDRRSIAFYQLAQYENVLDDVERAIKLGYERHRPLGPLLIRKAEALLKLGRSDEAQDLLSSSHSEMSVAGTAEAIRWNQLKTLSAIANRKVTKRTVDMNKFQDPQAVSKSLAAKGKFTAHEKYPWLSAKVDLHYDTEKGFQLISKENLAFGEVAAIGRPFASHVTDSTRCARCPSCTKAYCYNCFTPLYRLNQVNSFASADVIEASLKMQGLSSGPIRIPAPVPCPTCSNALYCSDYCRTDAWSTFHQFECAQVAALETIDDQQALLALRMLYSAGSLPYIRKVAKKWDSAKDPLLEMAENLVNPHDYAFIYPMRQPEVRNVQDELRRTVTACFLVKLAQMSGFVPTTTEDQHFAVTILLRHLLQLKANRTKVYRISYIKFQVSRVHGIFALMAPSCKGNIQTYDFLEGGNVLQSNVNVYYATSVLEAGSPLHAHFKLDCSQEYFKTGLNRRAYLTENFGFTCKCSDCERESMDRLKRNCTFASLLTLVARAKGTAGSCDHYYPIACSACGSLMIRPDGSTETGPYRCSGKGCNQKMVHHQMKTVYGQIDRLLALFCFLDNVKMETNLFQESALEQMLPHSVQADLQQNSLLPDNLEEILGYLVKGSTTLAYFYVGLFYALFSKCKVVPVSVRHGDAAKENKDEGKGYTIIGSKLNSAWKYVDELLNMKDKVDFAFIMVLFREISACGVDEIMEKYRQDSVFDRYGLLERYQRFKEQLEPILDATDFEQWIAVGKK